VPGQTLSELRRAIGADGFDRLVRAAETDESAAGTPGIGGLLGVGPPVAEREGS
jgi:hypothetical protein